MLIKLAISVVTTLLLCSCAGYHVRVGAPDKASSIAFDTLLVAHQVIESAKSEFQANNLPDKEKVMLNDLIKVYNVATESLNEYDVAVKNKAPNTNSYYSALTIALSEVSKALVTFKGVK